MGVRLLHGPFTVDDYYRLAETGLLHEDARVELLDGLVVQMSPIGPRHAGCVNGLSETLFRRLAGTAIVAVQNPVRLSERSEPQPDLAVLAHRDDRYSAAHPTPNDVLLIIEVADTTAETDRTVKIPLYARAGIREVWLVDFAAERIEVYRGPGPDGYRDVRLVGRGAMIAPLALPHLEISADEILGQ